MLGSMSPLKNTPHTKGVDLAGWWVSQVRALARQGSCPDLWALGLRTCVQAENVCLGSLEGFEPRALTGPGMGPGKILPGPKS